MSLTVRPISAVEHQAIQFKVGTGGQAVRYVGEWDLPLRPLVYRAFDLYLRRRGDLRRHRR